MDDKFSLLRAAVQKFLEQDEMPVGQELIEFQNAASVLTVAELLKAYDASKEALEKITADSSLGALSADEVNLISLFRTAGPSGSDWVMMAAQTAATMARERADKHSAEVVELRPKT